MATFTISIPDDIYQDVLAAFDSFSAPLEDEKSGDNARRQIGDFVRSVYSSYKDAQAREAQELAVKEAVQAIRQKLTGDAEGITVK